ncbi:hypothetical protein MMC09_002409 [Bachmanniomyces sp. S44760]|nr:hypothetical protein [Bachmanniomyces sp. S44760]
MSPERRPIYICGHTSPPATLPLAIRHHLDSPFVNPPPIPRTFSHPCRPCHFNMTISSIAALRREHDPLIQDLEQRIQVTKDKLWYKYDARLDGLMREARQRLGIMKVERQDASEKIRARFEKVWGPL